MNRHRARRRFVALIALVIVPFLAAPAFASVTATGIIGVDRVRALYPHIDGVDDQSGVAQRVAIVDTGIQWNHPALAGRVVAGVNYAAGATYGSENPGDYIDRNGHGTFVSGVIAANQLGLASVAPNVELVAVRVLADNGQGSFTDVTHGLKWINDHADALNITAVNVSLGTSSTFTSPGDVPSFTTFDSLRQQMEALIDRDIVTVVSAGNGGSSTGLSLPAIFDEVVSVAASTVDDSMASFSNRNPYLEALAPGDRIASLWADGGYHVGSGTSYAAPFVTAAAVLARDMIDHSAFVLEAAEADLHGSFTSFQQRFVNLIQSTGVGIYDPASDHTYDRLDLLSALQALDPNPPSVPEPASCGLMLMGLILMTRRTR